MTQTSENKQSYSNKVFVGSAYMVSTRFFVRFLGLFSVTILARVLTPEDFGIFATGALVLTLFIMIKDVGASEAIIKSETVTKEDLDTLWTITFILSVITSTALFLFAPVVAALTKEPRITEILQVMALVPLIDCGYSPASSMLVKNFKFKQEFILKFFDEFVRVIAVITLALVLRSYWALVYGALIAAFLGAIASQIVMPYVPRLTLVKRKKFGSFALLAYCRSIARYLANSADEFVVRASEGNQIFGVYHVAKDVTRVLIAELLEPIGYALLPTLVKLKGETERFQLALRNTVSVYLLAGIAISFGILAVADEVILILLGPQWALSAYFLSILAVGAGCVSLGQINQQIFIANDQAKRAALFAGIRAVGFTVSTLTAGYFWDTTAIATAFLVTSILVLLIELKSIFQITGDGLTGYRYLVRPVAGGMVMLATVNGMATLVYGQPLIIILGAKVLTGAFSYGVAIYSMWRLAGKPKGGEYALIERLPSSIRNKLI